MEISEGGRLKMVGIMRVLQGTKYTVTQGQNVYLSR